MVALDLSMAIKGAGLHVVGIAKDMEAALTLASCNVVDAATMDIELSRGSSGIETAEALWDRYAIPSLFVSGSLTEETRRSTAKFRTIGFFTKPVLAEHVVCALTAHFAKAQTIRDVVHTNTTESPTV